MFVPAVSANVLDTVVTPSVITIRPVSPAMPFVLTLLARIMEFVTVPTKLQHPLKTVPLLFITIDSALLTVPGLLLSIGVLSTLTFPVPSVLSTLWSVSGVTESTLTNIAFGPVFLTTLPLFSVILPIRGEPGSTATTMLYRLVTVPVADVALVFVVTMLVTVLGPWLVIISEQFVPRRPPSTGPFTTFRLTKLIPTATLTTLSAVAAATPQRH